ILTPKCLKYLSAATELAKGAGAKSLRHGDLAAATRRTCAPHPVRAACGASLRPTAAERLTLSGTEARFSDAAYPPHRFMSGSVAVSGVPQLLRAAPAAASRDS